jgi:hypothetical protein
MVCCRLGLISVQGTDDARVSGALNGARVEVYPEQVGSVLERVSVKTLLTPHASSSKRSSTRVGGMYKSIS